MSDLLKKSLLDMYRGDYYVQELLQQINYDSLSVKFNKELYARMTKEDCEQAQMLINSQLVRDYDVALRSASLAITRDLNKLLDMVLEGNKTGDLH